MDYRGAPRKELLLLRRRLVAAALIIFPALGLLWLDARGDIGPPGMWLTLLSLLVALLSAAEMIDLLRDNIIRPVAWPAYLGTGIVILAVASPEFFWRDNPSATPVGRWGWVMLALALSLCCALLAEMMNLHLHRHSTTRVALSLLVVTYSGGLMSFLLATRMIYSDGWGVLAVFSILFVVKCPMLVPFLSDQPSADASWPRG